MTFAEIGTGAVLVLGLGAVVWFSRGRPKAGFRPTEEVREDGGTGRVRRLYINPDTGEREYRDEPPTSRDPG